MLQFQFLLIACLLFGSESQTQPGASRTGQDLPASNLPHGALPLEEEAVEVSIEELTGIDYKRGRKLPDNIQDLDGKRIKITGYMAIGTLEGTDTFELVPEACECGRSKVQHFIEVQVENGGVTYQPGRVELEGVLSVGEVEEDGFVVSLYRLKIEDAP